MKGNEFQWKVSRKLTAESVSPYQTSSPETETDIMLGKTTELFLNNSFRMRNELAQIADDKSQLRSQFISQSYPGIMSLLLNWNQFGVGSV